MSEQDWFSKDFYKVLGVDKTKRTRRPLLKVYCKLARAAPGSEPGATRQPRSQVQGNCEAYAVPVRCDRKRYDAIVMAGGARFSAGSAARRGFEDP